ncbi:hypothetical protein LCGC14_1302470 [marine sediment metagenome]|uniref:Glycosyltransferase 2-like domain-containing protein n=1 Tax=marine sediment metagenome TaxID=412755 RepID=A0A0F9N5T0_9ZZZZ
MLKISIVIPTLNSERYLRETLESIKRQDYPWTEVYVVDGGSKDDTEKIARDYVGVFHDMAILHRKAYGEPDAINVAMEVASGDIMAYIDSDDVYEPGALWRVSEYFEGNPKARWLYGKGKIIDEWGEETRSLVTTAKSFWWPHYRYDVLQTVCFIVQPTVFWTRELWGLIGNFNAGEKLVFDYDYWLRAGKANRPGYIPHYLASWRAHAGAASVQEFQQEADDALRVQRKYSNGGLAIRAGQRLVHDGTVALYRFMASRVKPPKRRKILTPPGPRPERSEEFMAAARRAVAKHPPKQPR